MTTPSKSHERFCPKGSCWGLQFAAIRDMILPSTSALINQVEDSQGGHSAWLTRFLMLASCAALAPRAARLVRPRRRNPLSGLLMQKKRPDAWKSVGAFFCVPYMLLFPDSTAPSACARSSGNSMTIQTQNVGFQTKCLAL